MRFEAGVLELAILREELRLDLQKRGLAFGIGASAICACQTDSALRATA